jgi:hypothetical protein
MTVLITLTTAGSSTGPFSLYSNVDSYSTPFETGVAKSSLLAGYTSVLVPTSTTTVRVMSTGTCTNYVDISVVPCPTTTTTTSTSTSTTTTTTTTAAPCQQLNLYPSNATACAHLGSLTLFDTDNALAPTRLWVAGECGVTPVVGGNQWYSQGAGADSYQVDNGGFIVATTACP